MKPLRPGLSIVLAASLFSLAGVGPLCSPQQTEPMSCCKTSTHCGRGMRAAGCCRIEESAPVGRVVSSPAPDPRQKSNVPFTATAFHVDLSAGEGRMMTAAGLDRTSPTSPLLVHDSPPPLYLLNAAILR